MSLGWSAAVCLGHHPSVSGGEADRRIAFYVAKLAKDPNLYPVHAQLGMACLDKAVESFDPTFVVKARESFDRSLHIQPTMEAYAGHLAAANYSHRFEDALRWGAMAREAAPDDTGIIAKVVEAHLGLGDVDAAENVLDSEGLPPEDFFLAAARGHVAAARGQPDGAAGAFVKAAEFAKTQNVNELAGWAYVRAASVLLEAGRVDAARAHLDSARETALPTADFLLVHGRVLEAADQWTEALAVYETASKRSPSPDVHARISSAARRLGNVDRAQRHFEAAERAYRQVIDTGEVYSLGALARLYLEAETRLPEAGDLARRNLTFVRDRASVATLEALEARLRGSRD